MCQVKSESVWCLNGSQVVKTKRGDCCAAYQPKVVVSGKPSCRECKHCVPLENGKCPGYVRDMMADQIRAKEMAVELPVCGGGEF